MAGRREGRPEKNRISMKQIVDVLSKSYLDTLRRNADALLIGGVAAVRNHFQMFSLYTILDVREVILLFAVLAGNLQCLQTFSCSEECE